jgi:DNA-binding response OmpR family regulator
MPSLLIVEDEVELRSLLKNAFRAAGFEVQVAQEGSAVPALCKVKVPDLVISDIYMPGRGGLELLMDLKREHPNLKIIIMSGDVTAGDLLPVARTLGADRTFMKPFIISELVDAAFEVLGADARARHVQGWRLDKRKHSRSGF